jgi:tetratricopeptide (TPR) repeat protein
VTGSVRTRISAVSAAALVTMLTVPLLAAQPQDGPARLGRSGSEPCTLGVRILITWPKAPDKKTATDAIAQLRQNLRDFTSRKDVCVIEKTDADEVLTRSGYPRDTLMTTQDAISLAGTMRADEIVETQVTLTGRATYQFTGRLVLARDAHEQLRDSVPKPQPADGLNLAAKFFVLELKKVRAPLEFEKKCFSANREGKYADAEAAARQGIAAYPAGNISRICLAAALKFQKKPADAVLAVIDEVRRRDPNNTIVLRLALDVYFDKNDQDKYAEIASHLVTIDPTSPATETIIDNLVLWKKTDVAIPLLRKALDQDSENPNLLINQFRLTYGAGRWKEAAAQGENIARLDSTKVDTLFVRRMFSAYGQDSQPQRVLDWLNRGLAKFPDNIAFAQGVAQQLRTLGQFQQSITAYERVLKINPKEPGIRLRIAQTYANDMRQSDSAFVWLRRAVDGGDDKDQVAQLAFSLGGALFNATSKGSKDPEDFKKVIPFVAFSDSVVASGAAKYIWGVSALQIGNSIAQKMFPPAQPTCDLAKAARPWLETANEKIHDGARTDPTNAASMMDNTTKLLDFVNGQFTALRCQ